MVAGRKLLGGDRVGLERDLLIVGALLVGEGAFVDVPDLLFVRRLGSLLIFDRGAVVDHGRFAALRCRVLDDGFGHDH